MVGGAIELGSLVAHTWLVLLGAVGAAFACPWLVGALGVRALVVQVSTVLPPACCCFPLLRVGLCQQESPGKVVSDPASGTLKGPLLCRWC